MMKLRSILLIGIIALSKLGVAQNFEGEIIYKNTLKSKLPRFSDKQLTDIVGNRQEYYIREGNYKSITNGQAIVIQLYDNKTNRIYNKKSVSDTLYWFSASVSDDEIVDYEIKRDAALIMGHQCDALVLKTKSGVSTFYYSKDFALDRTKYKYHNYANWSFYTEKAGAVPLKIVVENKQFTMESMATEIKPLKLDDDYFDIGSQTPTKQSG